MEGSLYKWTNYWNGWQLRYFVLKDGVLYYYNNQEDSKSGGYKRSFKISMFDMIVNKNDATRVDLIIPNEQYLYLKALDYRERQKWLVALASHKATSTNLSNIVQHHHHQGAKSSTSTAINMMNDDLSKLSSTPETPKNLDEFVYPSKKHF
jgi:hypothetical protein